VAIATAPLPRLESGRGAGQGGESVDRSAAPHGASVSHSGSLGVSCGQCAALKRVKKIFTFHLP
jgi:hypothetical protein